MPIHKIEGGLNFYDELYKSLDDSENEDEINICQITSLPLVNNSVTLKCNHRFNYDALYKEIYTQKFHFKTYDYHNLLSNKERLKIKKSQRDYFIRCPYCRNIQFDLLPYYEELGLEKIYGINSVDSADKQVTNINNAPLHSTKLDNITFTYLGATFKKGACCFINKTYLHNYNVQCSQIYVTTLPETNISYCKYHYTMFLKNTKAEKKKQQQDEKIKLKEELKNKKEEILNQRKKLFEEKNIERAAKGLPLLQRLPTLKKKVENEVLEQNNQIGHYVPEEEHKQTQGCKSILKSGPNKGKQCSCKTINENGLCKRHSPKNENDL